MGHKFFKSALEMSGRDFDVLLLVRKKVPQIFLVESSPSKTTVDESFLVEMSSVERKMLIWKLFDFKLSRQLQTCWEDPILDSELRVKTLFTRLKAVPNVCVIVLGESFELEHPRI